MKITKQLLKEIIEEEINNILSEQLDDDFIRSVNRAAVKAWKAWKSGKLVWYFGNASESKIEPGSVELFITFKQGMRNKFKDKAISKLKPALEQMKQRYKLNGTFEIKSGSRPDLWNGQPQLSLFFKPSSGAASPRKPVKKPSAAPSVKPARTSSPKQADKAPEPVVSGRPTMSMDDPLAPYMSVEPTKGKSKKKPLSNAAKQNILSKRTGRSVASIQKMFKELFPKNSRSFRGGKPDGKYGPETEKVIKAVQAQLGFNRKQQDGLWGTDTEKRWLADVAKKLAKKLETN